MKQKDTQTMCNVGGVQPGHDESGNTGDHSGDHRSKVDPVVLEAGKGISRQGNSSELLETSLLDIACEMEGLSSMITALSLLFDEDANIDAISNAVVYKSLHFVTTSLDRMVEDITTIDRKIPL